MKLADFKKIELPQNSGVYYFRKGNDILYIGKATSLRDRVKSYFGKDLIETRGPLLVDMVFKADSVTFEETDSVLEALILEANLIKKYQPYYNSKEKDDKSFNYVCITEEEFPVVLLVRGKEIDFKNKVAQGEKCSAIFGPYPEGSSLREGLKIIRKIFPYMDKYSTQKDKYEFYRQIGLAPDIEKEDAKKEYQKIIRNVKLFFQGKKKQIIHDLKKEMNLHAKQMEFEIANTIKRTIFSLEHINDVALIKSDVGYLNTGKKFRIESYDIAHMSGKNMVGVMTVVVNGSVYKNDYRKFKIKTQTSSNDTGSLEEVLMRRLGHPEWGIPDLVVVDGGIAQKNVAERILKRYQFNIPVVSVVKDERHKPKEILGEPSLVHQYKKLILLANNESHRFGIKYHREMRSKKLLNP